MSRLYNLISRMAVVALCVVSLSLVGLTLTAHANPVQNPPKKKKLPPGSKGFEQFAGRDASDKLITGGGTRDIPKDAFDGAMARGNAAYDAEQYKEAAEAYKEATTIRPDSFKAFYSLGSAYESSGQYKEAAEAYKRAVALKLNDSTDKPTEELIAYYNLGNTYAAANQHKEAIEAYRQVIKRRPDLAMPYYNMGLSYAALGQQKEAVDAFKQALALKPKDNLEMLYYNMGVAYSKLEMYPEAAESFKNALNAKPDYAAAHYNLGLVYYMMDNQSGLAEQQKLLQGMQSPLAGELSKLIGK